MATTETTETTETLRAAIEAAMRRRDPGGAAIKRDPAEEDRRAVAAAWMFDAFAARGKRITELAADEARAALRARASRCDDPECDEIASQFCAGCGDFHGTRRCDGCDEVCPLCGEVDWTDNNNAAALRAAGGGR